jgi:SH3 domain protein
MKSLIRYFLLFESCFIFFNFSVQAEPMYVSDKLKVTVRTGQGNTHKIIALIKSDQEVEALENGEEWTLVRLQNGKKGWVLSRYLTNDIPKSIQLTSLQIKYKNVAAQAESLSVGNEKLKSDYKKLSVALSKNEKALKNLQRDYDTLKADSVDFLNLKTKFENASQQLASQTAKAEEFKKMVEKLQLYQYIKWFLTGSGVLLVGFIIGFRTKSRRRQPSLI